ncbi:MAG: hypothetical protein RIS34_366 [Pseudomonadota bacterium]|jgi:diguanylate cyclase (GGDEF)-like protein
MQLTETWPGVAADVSMKYLFEFVRAMGVRWFWPLLAGVLLAQIGVVVLTLSGTGGLSATVVLALAGTGLLGTGWLVMLLARLAFHTEEARQDDEAAYLNLREAIDEMPAAIELFDAQDRVVVYNRRMEEMFPQLEKGMALGHTFEEQLRNAIPPGWPAGASPEEQELWINQRLNERCATDGPQLQRLPDDNWAYRYETRTTSGWVATVRVDVTDMVRQREALDAARDQIRLADLRLREAVEAMPAGLEVFDSQDRLVLYNQQLVLMYPEMARELAAALDEGRTFESLLRYSIRAGLIPEAQGREEDYVAAALNSRATPDDVRLIATPSGRWLHVYEKRTRSGGVVGVRLDVTASIEAGRELERANEQLARLSTTDGLTGVANRRFFDENLVSEWQRSARGAESLSLLMIDIDHFKLYNDRYGHLAGDECLRQVAQVLGACVQRSGELVARYGGEEFAVLLPGTDTDAAVLIAQRCLDGMRRAAIAHADSPTSPHLSLSIGVATRVAVQGVDPTSLVEQADIALYEAKRGGRARLQRADSSP